MFEIEEAALSEKSSRRRSIGSYWVRLSSLKDRSSSEKVCAVRRLAVSLPRGYQLKGYEILFDHWLGGIVRYNEFLASQSSQKDRLEQIATRLPRSWLHYYQATALNTINLPTSLGLEKEAQLNKLICESKITAKPCRASYICLT